MARGPATSNKYSKLLEFFGLLEVEKRLNQKDGDNIHLQTLEDSESRGSLGW